MSTKLLWTGLTLVVGAKLLELSGPWAIAGAIIMAVAVVLMWMDK